MNIRFYILLLGSLFLLTSCTKKYSTRKQTSRMQNTPKRVVIQPQKKTTSAKVVQIQKAKTKPVKTQPDSELPPVTQLIVDTAYSYLGTPYKYAGTTRSGMDCSGLMHTCFLVADIRLNRSSDGIALQGSDIELSQARIGDLLFFKTSRRRAISHVGMVVEVGESVKFIHSSTSRGVIISDLKEPYWDKAFVKAKRLL